MKSSQGSRALPFSRCSSLYRAAVAALISGLIISMLPAAPPVARAELPSVAVDSAVLSIGVEGDRTSDGTVDGLEGVKLALHGAGEGSDRYDSDWSWTSCVSDTSGDCNFDIPIRAGEIDSTGVPEDTQFWVVEESVPDGWSVSPQGTPGVSSEGDYRFRTDAKLRAGETYRSTAEFTHADSTQPEVEESAEPEVEESAEPEVEESAEPEVEESAEPETEESAEPETEESAEPETEESAEPSAEDPVAKADEPVAKRDGEVVAALVDPNLQIHKYAFPATTSPVTAGQVIYYDLNFYNAGPDPLAIDFTDYLERTLDDADLTADPISSDASVLVTLAPDGRSFHLGGTLAAGWSVSVFYQVTVKALQSGDGYVDNFVREGVTGPPAPDDPCDPADTMCTTNPVVGDPVVTKTSNPPPGTPVAPGDLVEYTLSFTNTGNPVPISVAYGDELMDVVDDGVIEVMPVSSHPSVEVFPPNPSPTEPLFYVLGQVPVETTVTVKYSVRVNEETFGNANLRNCLRRGGGGGGNNRQSPRIGGNEAVTPLAATEPICTQHLVLPSIKKTSDPGSGEEVTPGQVISYTLTLANEADLPVTVDYTDYLAAVLDDADLLPGIQSSDPAVTAALAADGQSFHLDGTLAAGASATITYQVKVKDSGFGNGVLDNFVRAGVHNPPEPDDECDGGDLCTTHPVGGVLLVEKTADPATGTAVAPGGLITYTLTFSNTGAAPVAVDHVDDLADVLDDGVVEGQPTTSDPSLSVTPASLAAGDTSFTVAGTVAAESDVTVTYSVRVNDDDFGNGTLVNCLDAADPADPSLCTTNPVPAELTVKKSSDPISGTGVLPGDVISYTLTFANAGGQPSAVDYTDYLAAVLDDANLTQDPVASDPALTITQAADSFDVDGTVAGGASITVTYQVTVKDSGFGDGVLDNFVRPSSDPPPGPDEVCNGGDLCTTHPVPGVLVVAKSAIPATGTPVVPGGLITYTLTFTNTGGSPVDVDHVDDLADVIDDGVIEGQPVSSDPSLSVTPTMLGTGDTSFTVAGTVAAESAVTVTYSVRVNTAGFSNGTVVNCLEVADGAGDPLCTTHPVAGVLDFSKTSDPATGTPVAPGDLITYTLTFTNTGGSAVAVDHVDDLAGVVDDGVVEGQPVSSDPSLVVAPAPLGAADASFTIKGTVAAESSVTVTYSVRVNDNSFGDGTVVNCLAQADGAGNVCTTHPVLGELVVTKTASPPSGTVVDHDQDIVYTLVFANTGGSAVTVDHLDSLLGALDDGDLSAGPTGAPAGLLTIGAFDAATGSFTVDGVLPAGATFTVSYTVKVKPAGAQLGDGNLVNVVLTGDTPPVDPPTGCPLGDPREVACTEHPLADPALVVTKSANPVSGTTVAPGDVINYTLTFASTGGKAAAVDYTDYLAGILDDATITNQPVVSDPSLTVSPTAIAANTQSLLITGSIPGGRTVTVTYSVTVDTEGFGDGLLKNFLRETDDEPPTSDEVCAVGDTLCTQHPIPAELSVIKDSNPASGTTVQLGSTVSYTLTFSNTGGRPAAVDHTDHLLDVPTMGAIGEAPAFVAGNGFGLTISPVTGGNTFTVEGDLEPGKTAVVTYTVVVEDSLPAGSDGKLTNVLVPGPGDPGPCVEPDDLCTEHPVDGKLEVVKTASPTGSVEAGGDVDYTITFRNVGGLPVAVDQTDDLRSVLDDADITSEPTADDATWTVTPTPLAGADNFRMQGNVAPGGVVTVTYTATVRANAADRGDNRLINVVVPGAPLADPPTDCDPAVEVCTDTPVRQLVVTKSVNPASGSTVAAGQELTYTLTFQNVALTDQDVDYSDDLAGVLDDADLVGDPGIVDAGGSMVVARDGDSLTVNGTLTAGSTATVTYVVRVKPAAERGDSVLLNFLLEGDTDTPSTCEAEVLCTENPVGDFSVTKSVDPATGTVVNVDDQLTYTLTFRNTGATVQAVDYTDHLADVLDDAVVVKTPAIAGDDHGLSVSGVVDQAIRIQGDQAAGTVVQVTYTIRVTGEGNGLLLNVVNETGTGASTECITGDPLCTENPITKDPGDPGDPGDQGTPEPPGTPGTPGDPGGPQKPGVLSSTGGTNLNILLGGIGAIMIGLVMVARRRRELV